MLPPEDGTLRPFQATVPTKALTFTPFLTILWGGGMNYGTHIDNTNTPTNFVPVLHSNEIRQMTKPNYGTLP
jgi:hypothetical protein